MYQNDIRQKDIRRMYGVNGGDGRENECELMLTM